MEDLDLNPEEAHPYAKALLTEDFYWSFEYGTGPLGSNIAYDVYHSFQEWQEENEGAPSVEFVYEYLDDMGYPELDLNETRIEALINYTSAYHAADSELDEAVIAQAKAHAKNKAEAEGRQFDESRFMQILTGVKPHSGLTFLADIDKIIIATAFCQLMREGAINADLKSLASHAIERESLPMLLEICNGDEKTLRQAHLENMSQKLADAQSDRYDKKTPGTGS